MTVPFNRCYWISPDKLLAGCYPGSHNEKRANAKLQGLLNHGIRHVINLMEPDESDRAGNPFAPYDITMSSIADAEGMDITFGRMPITDLSIPTRDEMIHILDVIDTHINDGKAVYVHCRGGRGRTGTVIGCYLARHGLAVGKRALWMIQKLRKSVMDFNLSSPETIRQIDMVASWGKGE